MKKVVILLLSVLLILSFVGCSNNKRDKYDTNLEFWICDNVDNFDFSDYQPRYGLMGGKEYYGSGYTPTLDENDQQVDPEHCVIYTITSYPDYSSSKAHITGISITDPDVKIYGLTLNSSDEDIKSTMKSNGFKLKEEYPNSRGFRYSKGKISISFTTNECIRISAEVSNIWGIQF